MTSTQEPTLECNGGSILSTKSDGTVSKLCDNCCYSAAYVGASSVWSWIWIIPIIIIFAFVIIFFFAGSSGSRSPKYLNV